MNPSGPDPHEHDFDKLFDENRALVEWFRPQERCQKRLEEAERLKDANQVKAREAGSTLGEYELRRAIGRGGMGVVYEAWQPSMQRTVALKVLPGGLLADLKAVARFEREAQIAGQLQHPNIVGVHGVGVDDNTPYFVMELVEGETLDKVLGRLKPGEGNNGAAKRETVMTRLSKAFHHGGAETTALRRANGENRKTDPTARSGVEADESGLGEASGEITPIYCYRLAEAFAGVAEGLQHAHQKGIVHRDLKPANLILDESGRLRILDFGLARLEGQESLTVTGEFLGTPLYMSPEQARAPESRVDGRTDVYSLGATMYEMLTFEPPHRGRDHRDTLARILNDEPRAPRRPQPSRAA